MEQLYGPHRGAIIWAHWGMGKLESGPIIYGSLIYAILLVRQKLN